MRKFLFTVSLLALLALPSFADAGHLFGRRGGGCSAGVSASGGCGSQVQGRVFGGRIFHRR